MFWEHVREASSFVRERLSVRISTPSKFYLWVLLWTAVVAFAAYLFQWTSTAYSHDSLVIYQFAGFENMATYLNNGRFFTPLYLMVRGGISAPLLIGILGTLFLSVAIALVLWLLDLKGRLLSAALAGALAVNASITLLNVTYIKDFDVYMFALLLCVLGVRFVMRYKHGYVAGGVCFAFSLGLYQAYIQFALVLMLLMMLKMLLTGSTSRRAVRTGVRAAASCLIALVLYALVLFLLVSVFDFHFDTGYNSLATKASIPLFSAEFAHALLRVYAWPFMYLLLPETHANVLVGILNATLFVLSVIVLVRLFRQQRMKASAILFAVILLLLMPLAAGCIYPFSVNVFHGLTIYAYHAFYLLPAMLFCTAAGSSIAANKTDESIERSATARVSRSGRLQPYLIAFLVGTCCIASFNNVVYANQVSLEKNLVYETTVSIMTRIADAMDRTEGYTPGTTPVVFVGLLQDNPVLQDARPHYTMKRIGARVLYGTGLWHDVSVTYSSTYEPFFRNILGYPVRQLSAPPSSSPELEVEIDEMPTYPSPGYIEMIDGVLYVKLS